ncbi:unnamed protein product [Pieris macdunnoughi]|uniref:Uncharacterized protein n=1 Tax=Pieris macdunnoughi TaxID=345717 RepID=A0A821RAU8_9NEOP|nr:unnamed protein product [Pieris macdunnoughi]
MKSGRVKNPCKICFETVNKKKGMQCKGACQKWAHYKCLDFSPGKIKDVKDGHVKITCPCPDCDAPDAQKCCAAKKTCTSASGPSAKPIPYPPQYALPYTRDAMPVSHTSCGMKSDDVSLRSSDITLSPRTTTGSTSPQLFMACPPNKTFRSKQTSPKISPEPSRCGPCCTNKRTHSTSALESSSSDSGINIKCVPRRASSSDSKLPTASNQKELIVSLDEMCKTVGRLSTQLRELMFKMIESNKL